MKRVLLFPARFTSFLYANNFRVFKVILMILVLITALYTKEYRGLYQSIINNNLGGLFYVFFWSLFFSLVMGKAKAFWPVTVAFVLTCMLEYVQYLQIPVLQSLGRQKVFAYLFGTSYNTVDFGYYAGGAIVGLVVLMLLQKEKKKRLISESIDPLGELRNSREAQPEKQLLQETIAY